MKKLQFYFDYYVGYFLTHPAKRPFYHCQMYKLYGNWYCTKEEFEAYWNNLPEDQ